MENLQTTLFKSITKIAKESRLVFMAPKKPAPKPKGKVLKPKGAAKGAPTGKPAPKAPLTPDTLKAKVKEKVDKLKAMMKGGHTPEFKAQIKTYINKLELSLKGVLKDKKIDAKENGKFTLEIKITIKRAEVAQKLDKIKKTLNDAAFKKAKDAMVAKILATVPGKYAKLKPVIEASIRKSLGEVQSQIQKILGNLGRKIDGAGDKGLAAITKTLSGLPKTMPTSINDFLKVVGKYPRINKMLLEVLEYLEALKHVFDKKLMTVFLGKCSISTGCGKALGAWLKTVEGWAKSGNIPKGKALVDAVLKAQTKIIMSQVFDLLKKHGPKILEALKKALKKIPGALKGKEINIDVILKFLQNYASFSNTGAEAKRKIAQLLAKAISFVTTKIKTPLKIDMVVEGGADSQPITLSRSLVKRYEGLQGVAKRLFTHVKRGKGLRKLPQIKQYGSELTAFKNADDVYKFLMKKTKNGTDKAAMEKWLGGGGVLNTLLFISRSEDMSGKLGSAGNLFAHKDCKVGGYATSSGRPKGKDRFSRVSFLAKNSKLRQSSVPGKPTKVPQTPAQIEAAKLAAAKAEYAAAKAKAGRAITSAKGSVKAVNDDPKLDKANPQLKGKIAAIEDKIKAVKAETGKALPAKASEIKARTAKLKKLIGELNKLEADLNKLKVSLLAAKVPTKLPKVKPGKKGEYLGFKYKKSADGKRFIINGTTHELSEYEFKVVVGVERPSEKYKKGKIDATYVRKDIKRPTTLSYDPDTKIVTGTYEYPAGSNKLTVTYNIKTGVRTAKLDTGADLRKLLPKDAKAAAKKDLIKAALKDGLAIDAVEVVDDPAEASLKTIKEHLVNGRWMDGLKLLIDQPKKDIALITRCVEKLAIPGTDWTLIDTTKTKPLVVKIIEDYRRNFTAVDFASLAELNGGTASAKMFAAIINSKKLTAGPDRNRVIAGGAMLYPTDKTVAKAYIEEAFGTGGSLVTDDNKIKAIKAYAGDWAKAKPAVLKFIVDNYTGKFDTAKFKLKIHEYLAAEDPKTLTGEYDKAFKLIYPNPTAIQTLATKKKGAEVWAKHEFNELMDSDVDKLFTAGDKNIIKFVDTLANLFTATVGTITVANKIKAENILKRIEGSKNPKTLVLVEALITGLTALPGGLSPDADAIEKKVQKRLKDTFDVATGAKKASYENRVQALTMFISGEYKNKIVNGVPAAKGAQGSARDKYMKGLLAGVHYDEEKLGNPPLTVGLIAELPKERKEFVEYCQDPATLDEPGMKMILGNRNKIGVEAIRTLANHLSNGYEANALRLYKAIGMKEAAAEMLSGVTDDAEKGLLKTLLDHVDKRYKDMTPDQRKKVREGLAKAYDDITSGTTSDDIQMRIIEQMFELQAHMTGRGKTQLLKLLDRGGADGYLNALADPTYTAPATGTKPTPAQVILLRAKELRAKVELDQVKANPASIARSNMNQLAKDLDVYQAALGKKPLDKSHVDTLKKIYIKKHADLTTANKKAFARVMLKAAEAHKDPKYLVGGYGNASIDIQVGDLSTGDEKVRYYKIQKQYLKAADHEADNDKRVKLIEKSKKAPKDIAEAYEKVETVEGQYRAAKIYIKENISKAKAILSRTAPVGTKPFIPKGRAETLIKTMPKGNAKIEAATARGLKKVAYKTFRDTPGSKIDVSMLSGAGAPTAKEVLHTLKKAKRKVEPVGTNTAKTTLLTAVKAVSPDWDTLNPTQQDNIEKGLTT
jgi:hypothetical protein